MINNRLSTMLPTTNAASNPAINAKTKKTLQPFQFLRPKTYLNMAVNEASSIKLQSDKNENESEFLDADQFDFDQLHPMIPKTTSVNSSLSSSRLSLPATQNQYQMNQKNSISDKTTKGTTKQRLFNFIYNSGNIIGKNSNNQSKEQPTNQQRRLSDFHRPTKVIYLNEI